MKRSCLSKRILNAFLDGELEGEKAERVKAHLKDCPLCQEEVRSLKTAKLLVSELPAPEKSEIYWEQYERHLMERVSLKKATFGLSHRALRYAVVAFAMLLLSVGIVSGSVSPIRLEIFANVPGASVYIDGKLAGITPCQETVSSGYHSLSLHKEGYQNWEHEVLASSISPMRVEVRLLPRAFTENPREIRQFAYASFSPNGENLALLGSRRNFEQGTGELWLFNFGSKSLAKIKEGIACVRPAWSPDSKRVAFVSAEAEGDFVSIYDLDTLITRTTSRFVGISQVAWLDRERVAFISGEQPSILIFELLSSRTYSVPTAPVERFTPSPDGSWIAYNSAKDGKIYLLPLATMVNYELPLNAGEYFALSWSPSGNYLAIASKSGAFLWDLREERALTISQGEVFELSWAKDDLLLYLSVNGEERAIFSFHPADNAPELLYSDSWTKESLTASPDSSFYLFASNNSGFFQIYRHNFLNPQEGTSALFQGSSISISSSPQAAEIYLSGKYLGRTPTVLSALPAGSYEFTLKKENYAQWVLYVPLSDGEFKEVRAVLNPPTGPVPLTRTEGEKREAALSSDTRWLAYSEGPEEDSSLYILDLNTRNLKYLGPGRQPAWSPSGEALYFTRGFGYSDIWVYDLGNGQFHQLTFSGGAQSPILSPKGGWIAYLAGLDPRSLSLWLMNEDGSDQRLIAQEEGTIFKFAWSPNGNEINYLVHKSGMDWSYIVNLQGETRLLHFSAGLTLASWDPEGKFLALVSWSELERELRIYSASSLEFYYSQKIEQPEFPIFWRKGKIHWAQKEGEQLRIYGMDIQEGTPESGNSWIGARIQGYLPELDQVLISASWTGYSQLYLVTLTAP